MDNRLKATTTTQENLELQPSNCAKAGGCAEETVNVGVHWSKNETCFETLSGAACTKQEQQTFELC